MPTQVFSIILPRFDADPCSSILSGPEGATYTSRGPERAGGTVLLRFATALSELGDSGPSEATLGDLAFVLQFPVAFFVRTSARTVSGSQHSSGAYGQHL